MKGGGLETHHTRDDTKEILPFYSKHTIIQMKRISNNIILSLRSSVFSISVLKIISMRHIQVSHGYTDVRFRSRASLGIMGDGAPSLSQCVGLDR